MFLMTWRGMVTDRLALRDHLLEWLTLFAETAAREGWIGSSGGITGSGEFLALGLMDSPLAARRLGDRPGQAEWWDRTRQAHVGPIIFRNCSRVEGSGEIEHLEADWIEVIEGYSTDIVRMRDLAARSLPPPPRGQPGVVALLLGFPDEEPGRFIQANYRVRPAVGRDAAATPSNTATTDADDMLDQLASVARDTTRHVIDDPWIDWAK